jgi:hypothetical protein
MTQHFPPSSMKASISTSIVTEAMRCWRAAGGTGHAVQPQLAALLAGHDATLLAPVLDSLFRLFELALDHRISVGGIALSSDEHLLLDLLEGSSFKARSGCPQHVADLLECALCSTRIMLAAQ